MNKLGVILGAGVAALSLSTFSAQAEDLTFELVNESSSSLVGFYVSHTGTKKWEENLLEGAYLPSGNVIDVNILDGRDVCEYDIRGEFEDGSKLDDYELDLCDLGTYTFQDE